MIHLQLHADRFFCVSLLLQLSIYNYSFASLLFAVVHPRPTTSSIKTKITTRSQSLCQVCASPRLILLDRDGVINHDVGAPGVLHPSQLELTPNAAHAIANLRQNIVNCKIAIITNQSCVGKGFIDETNDLAIIHDTLQKMLLQKNDNAIIDHIFYCTSLRDSNDYRMKPNPGMIYEACDYFNVTPCECVMIGDAIRDLEAAGRAGVPIRILVQTGYGLDVMNQKKAPCCNNDEEEMMVTYVDKEYINQNDNGNNIVNESNNENVILPFYYAKNLSTASKWLLQTVQAKEMK